MTDAVTRAPWVPIATVVAAAMVAQAFGRFTYGLVLPAVQTDLAVSYTVAGAIGTANLAAYLAGSATVAWLSTRFTLDRIMKAGIVGSTIGLAAFSWSPGIGMVWFAMVLTGFAGAAIWIPAPAVVSGLVSARHRGAAMGLIGTGIGIGLVTAGWAARSLADWRALYGAEAIIAVGVAVAVWTVVRRPVESEGAAAPSLTSLTAVPQWRVMIGTYGGFGLSMSLFLNFVVARLEDDAGWTTSEAAGVFALMGASTIAGGVLVGRISDVTGRGRAMVAGFAAMASGSLLVLAGDGPWPWIAAVIFGVAFAGVPVTIAAHLRDHLTTQQFGSAFGVITLAFGVGQLLAPVVGGAIADVTGRFTVVFLIAAVVAGSSSLASIRVRH